MGFSQPVTTGYRAISLAPTWRNIELFVSACAKQKDHKSPYHYVLLGRSFDLVRATLLGGSSHLVVNKPVIKLITGLSLLIYQHYKSRIVDSLSYKLIYIVSYIILYYILMYCFHILSLYKYRKLQNNHQLILHISYH